MLSNRQDPLAEALRGLAAWAPPDLVDRVFGNWLRTAGPLGDVYVAFTDHGVGYLRTSAAVHGSDAEFVAACRRDFGRPLRRAGRPPAGLLPALAGRSARTLRLDLRALTEFQRAVLTVTRRIPAGQTRPYSWVAREAGRPRAVRAVGSALARNPVPILVPCHRVTRGDGEPGDYVFGAEAKERLLLAERVNLTEVRELARHDVFYIGSDVTNIVCFPTCHNARRISAAHRQGFRDMAQAGHRGYRPCKHCRPAVSA